MLVHLACIAALWSGVTYQALAIGFALYWLRIFGIGAGYHRYFSRRAYRTSRVFQFVLRARNKCGRHLILFLSYAEAEPM